MIARRGVAVLAAALVLPGVACGSSSPTGEQLPGVELPSLSAPDDPDAALALDELRGPAVVNLWATWCAPCRRELPDFQAVHDELGDDVAFVGVNIGDDAADAAAYLDEIDVTFDQYLDPDGELTTELGTASLPVTLVVDETGTVTTEHLGPMSRAELLAAIGGVTTSGSVSAPTSGSP